MTRTVAIVDGLRRTCYQQLSPVRRLGARTHFPLPIGCKKLRMSSYDYMLCGWYTRSNLPLTSVPSLTSHRGAADIIIQIAHGTSPLARHSSRRLEHSTGYSLLGIEGWADF